MNISKAELVERLRFLAVWNGGEAWKDQSGGGERWSVPDVLTEAADFIEQSISPPDVGEVDVQGIVEHVRKYDVAEGDLRRVFTIAQMETAIRAASTLPAPDHGVRGLPPFAEAWAKKEAAGYRYNGGALENVAFGYAIAEAELAALNKDTGS